MPVYECVVLSVFANMTLAKLLTMALESLHNLTVPQAVVSLATAVSAFI